VNDEELDELVRNHVRSRAPRPDRVASLVAQARPQWERRTMQLALAAAIVLVALLPLGDALAPASDGEVRVRAAVPMPVTDVPTGMEIVPLPADVGTLGFSSDPTPGFPAVGDLVSVLATQPGAGAWGPEPQTRTLLQRVEVVGVEPVRFAVTPDLADKMVEVLSQLQVAVAVHVGDRVDVQVRRGDALALAPGDRVDIDVEFGGRTYRYEWDVEVVQAEGDVLRLRVRPDQAEKLVHGSVRGTLSAAVR
jgi:hypothetical protein